MKKSIRIFIKIIIFISWILFFYLQYERPRIAHLAQNLSPGLVFSNLLHSVLWFICVYIPFILLAIFKGRFFCWNICPVGLAQDFIPSRSRTKTSNLNLYLFLVLLVISLFGLNLLAILDPLVTFNKSVILLGIQAGELVLFLTPIFIILLLNIFKKRFWCFRVCPLGAFLDWIIKLKSGAPRANARGTTLRLGRTSSGETRRSVSAIEASADTRSSHSSTALQPWLSAKAGKKRFDIDKRRTLIALGSGVVLGLFLGRKKLFGHTKNDRLLRPPGAVPEHKFTEKCIRCGSCISICLTGTLTPSFLESGFAGIFTPKLVPQIAECDENCNKCGQACPSHAIQNLALDTKRNIKIGTARIDRSLCIAWSKDSLCLVCQEFCPYLAIKIIKNKKGTPCPEEIPDICRGCGLCEKNCPARPERAIKVYNYGAGEMIKE